MLHDTAAGTDSGMAAELEDFIRQQKNKLAHERAVTRPKMSPRGRIESPPTESHSHPQGAPLKPVQQEVGFMAKMGTYEEQKRRLQDERKREYNEMLQKKNLSLKKPVGGTGDATTPRDSRLTRGAAAKNPGGDVLNSGNGRPLRGLHNVEYEHMLSGKSKRRERAYTPDGDTDYPRRRQTPPPDRARHDNGASGLPNPPRRPRRDSMSDGDDEYQQFLQQRAPRRGWATPTYEETLEEKRREERRYRRHDDPELYQPFELRNSVSDGHLDLSHDEDDRRLRLDDDRRYRGPYRDQDTKKVRFHTDQPRSRQNGQSQREPEYTDLLSTLKPRHRRADTVDGEDGELLPNRRHDLNLVLSHKVALPPKTHNPHDDETYGTSLPIGHELSLSEQLRRKEEYRQQLTSQIEQGKAKKNSVEQWVDAYKDHEIPYRTRAPREWEKPAAGISSVKHQQQQPQQQLQQQPQQMALKVSQYPEAPSRLMDDLVRQPPDRLPPTRGTNGILERGFEGLYEPLSKPSMTPAPQPTSLLNMPGVPSYANQLDQAYHYYGSKSLLDPSMPATAPPMSGPVGYTPQSTYSPEQPPMMSTQPTPRANFNAMSEREAGMIGQVGLGSDDSRRKEKQMSYQAELLKQIEEQKNKKLRQKQDEERYNMKMEEQLKIYDPFGKGGGGAPVRDADGNLVTNLRMMHLDNEEKWRDPSKFTGIQPVSPRVQVAPPAVPVTSHQQATLASPVAEGGPPQEQQYARGSSLMRILGDGMTEVQKTAQQKYQDDLRRQIEDKKRKLEEEKRQQQLEDERLMQKIEDENRKMQEQLEEEKRKDREKQEEAQRQQEQLKKAQEERRMEVERTRKDAEEKRQEDIRRKQEEEQQRRKPLSPGVHTTSRFSQPPPPSPPIPTLAPVQPPPSPPIPTMRGKEEKEEYSPPRSPPVPALLVRDSAARMMDERPISPPLPANRSKTYPEKMVSDEQLGRKSPPVPARRSSSRESRPPSAEVLNQLAHMRKQLLNERKRIEGDLKKTQDEPEVYDPRVYPRSASKKSVDVFEVARTGEPVSVHRQGDVSSSNLREFHQLRNKEDTESRQNLRSMFPDEPMTSDALETQQRILLTEQDEVLKKMAKRKSLMKRLDPHDLGLLREGSVISANMLDSDSAFIAVPNGRQSGLNSGHTERLRQPPTPSSGRRRRRQVETPDSIYTNPMGSVRSLDPESINNKNEERLRRLKALTGDDISVADPEDVLDRFMAKQQYKRPPSRQTLDDDTWLRPGTGTNG